MQQVYSNYSIDKNIMKDILKEAKQIELKLAINKIQDENFIVIRSYLKKSPVVSNNSKTISKN
jgi:hypothetical protein